MTTAINAIKEIVKWAKELPDWQSDALRRLFVNGTLSQDEKQEVVNIAKQFYGLPLVTAPPAAIPFTSAHAPGQSIGAEITYLKKIRDIKHVNALASGQTISFGGKGVTVVYGDNGTGKSGYSRLLKRACRARHTEVILPNIHETTSSACVPEAVFDIQVGDAGRDESFTWKEGDATPDKLSQIAVFDTHCARVFVDEANTVSYVPYGLDVFPKLASLFDELKSQLSTERSQLQHRDEILQGLQGEHEVGKLIGALSSKTDIGTINNLSIIDDEEEKEFEALDVAVKDLLANDPQKQAVVIRRTKSRIEQQRDILRALYKAINKDAIQKLQDAWQTAKTKADAAKLASSKQFPDEPLPGVSSDAWKEMYKHAREYSVKEAYPEIEFPVTNEGSLCPLCMQELAPDARDRLKRFEKYVSNITEKEAVDAKNILVTLFKPIKELDLKNIEKTLLADICDINNETGQLLENSIPAIKASKNLIIEAVQTGDWTLTKELDIDVVSKLNIIISSLEVDAKTKDKLVNPEKQKQLRQKHSEITARTKLNQHKTVVLRHITKFKEADRLTDIINSLNSRTVSTKASQLSQLVLTSELKAAIDKELSTLKINHIELGLKSSSPKGTTKHQLVITDASNSNKLTSILSEGEQRVIAIASFLGELGLSPIKAGVVFDDPVSSLDHKWAERMADRLVKEGADRQIIIFTHNIGFLLALYKYSAKHQVYISSQSLHRVLKESGQCNDSLPWSARNASKRTDRLDEIVQSARSAYKKDPDGDEYRCLHDKFFSRLRSTWERTVEEVLLNNVVMRFDSGVSTQLLNGVVVDDEDYRDVFNAMGDSSEGIDAHDHAAGQHDQINDPDDMNNELVKLKEFKSRVDKKKQDAIKRRKESIKAPVHD
jgi:energy-coupling factor transporter ATP-binding protein EcfA2